MPLNSVTGAIDCFGNDVPMRHDKTTSHITWSGKRMGNKDIFTEGTIISFQKLGSSN